MVIELCQRREQHEKLVKFGIQLSFDMYWAVIEIESKNCISKLMGTIIFLNVWGQQKYTIGSPIKL